MKIAIDCRMIDRSGIGTVIREVVPRLLATPHRFVLLGDPQILNTYANDRIEIISFLKPIYSIGEQIGFPRRIFGGIDVLLCPHYNIPISIFPRIVVIVHDLAHLVLPRIFRAVGKRAYAHLFFRILLRNAAMIISPSEFTHNEILRYLRISPEKLVTIPNGPGRFFTVPVDMSIEHRARYNMGSSYILSVGNIKPHKNLEVLLEAFLTVKKAVDPKLKLVIAGQSFETDSKKDPFVGWSMERLTREGVVLTGRVSDEDLGMLYTNARLLVAPSLYEGFGLTPLEALRFGTLPLVADAASLPEVVDDPDLRFSPRNPKELSDKMIRSLCDGEYLNSKLTEQRTRIKRFSWDATAKAYLDVLERIVCNRRAL
jgi:glycosyltransferase involved in cell wall biosynthesis